MTYFKHTTFKINNQNKQYFIEANVNEQPIAQDYDDIDEYLKGCDSWEKSMIFFNIRDEKNKNFIYAYVLGEMREKFNENNNITFDFQDMLEKGIKTNCIQIKEVGCTTHCNNNVCFHTGRCQNKVLLAHFIDPNELCDCGYIADENNICTGCGLKKPEQKNNVVAKEKIFNDDKKHTDKDMINIVGAFLSAGCPNYPTDHRGSWIKWCEMYLSNKKLNNQ